MQRTIVAALQKTAPALLALLLLEPAAATAQTVKFKHIIMMMQETRSTDNLFGSNPTFEPGVDIATTGNMEGQTVPLTPRPLVDCYDIHRNHIWWVEAYDGGKMDGFDLDPVKHHGDGCTLPANPAYVYVDNSTGAVQSYFDIATNYGFANRFFHTNQGMSFPAHQFLFGGTSAPSADSSLFISENGNIVALNYGGGCLAALSFRIPVIDPQGSETAHPPVFPCSERQTLGDMLTAAKISWKYYTPSVGSSWTAPNAIRHICRPEVVNGTRTCTGLEFKNHVVPNPHQILSDIADCQLASVNWVMPFVPESDHNEINKGLGPDWVGAVVNAVGSNPACAHGESYWNDTVILITWSEWGGWYDHVLPYQFGQPNHWGQSYVYGFRVPLLVVSAYTPAGYVDNTNSDFGTLLRFTELNFNLGTIPPGDYADSYAQNPLAGFFTPTPPRAFVPIPVQVVITNDTPPKPDDIDPDADD